MSKQEEVVPEAEQNAAVVEPVESPREEVTAEPAEPVLEDGTPREDDETAHDVDDADAAPVDEPAATKDKRLLRFTFGGAAVGLLVGFCLNFAVTGVQDIIKSSSATAITVAVSDCKVEDRDGVVVSDSNKHLSIDTKGTADSSGASTQNAVCLVQALQVPQDVLTKLNDTKPDGTQHKEEWSQREMSWEFSDDKGIKIDYQIK